MYSWQLMGEEEEKEHNFWVCRGENLCLFSAGCWLLPPSSPLPLLKFGAFIDLWVRNPTKLSLHQLDFGSSSYWILNGQRSTLTDCEIWLWRLWLPWYFSFYFSCITFSERYGCYIFNATGITSNMPITFNLLLFASFIQKCLQNIKQRISRHFTYKTWTKH